MEQEQQHLEHYASITNRKILVSQTDLDPKDRAMPKMLNWCRKQEPIVVLQSGKILTSQPSSRLVQNCKIVMSNKGLTPGEVHPTTSKLIRFLLENAEEQDLSIGHDDEAVSNQQQRLRTLIKEALDTEASDIHIEVRTDMAQIRFRKHGELHLHAEWLPKLAREVVSVAFNKETDHAISHFNPLIPQNASMPLLIDNQEVRLRLASLPAHNGFDVVLRILAVADERIVSLQSLGYTPEQVKLLQKAINMPHGAIILAGPTGSGKTTALASCMQQVDEQRKVYTIEDPVEKAVTNVTQVPVNTDQYDRSFASMARTALRMDPDVIVLGEMRDEDTAQVMIRAAITGHLVFSTIHTNSATDIITRLNNLSISHPLLASPDLLVCLICQRLAPVLCSSCSIPLSEAHAYEAHLPRWKSILGEHFSTARARGQGCPSCNHLGISRRTVVAEVIWVDEASRSFIKTGDTLGWYHHLKENGWLTYRDQLLGLIQKGTCDPLDAEKLAGEFNTNAPRPFDYTAQDLT